MPGVLYARVSGAWVPISTGGGSVSEVEIGTADPIPTNANAELWYDTDDDTIAGPFASNALGIVAVGSFTFPDAANLTNGAAMTLPLVYTMAVGRRYRLRIGVRALNSAGNAYASLQFAKDGVTQGDRYIQIIGAMGYNKFETEWVVDGDGLSHSWVVNWASPYTVTGYSSGGYYYIEDAGPSIAQALPVPETAPGWTQMVLLNGWVSGGAMPSYRRIGDVVTLRGSLGGGTAVTRTGLAAATLPVGFRPPFGIDYMQTAGAGYALNVNTALNGNITPQMMTAAISGPANTAQQWCSLDGIFYSVTP